MVGRLVGYVWDTGYGWVASGNDEFTPVVPGNSTRSLGQRENNAYIKRQLHEAIQLSPIAPHLRHTEPFPAEREDILRVHSGEYYDSVRSSTAREVSKSAANGTASLVWGSYGLAARAAGGAVEATRSVLDGEVDTAYALVNPPGNHASRAAGQDSCVFNNASVAAAYARATRGVTRVAIIDLDVRHANGTQDIWWDNPDVLTVSVHQNRCYPVDSGFRDERGAGDGFGANLNVPLPPGSGNAVHEQALTEVVLPALAEFQPELIVVAAGFGASVLDPVGRQMVTRCGFRTLTRHLLRAAGQHCDGNIVFIQEGATSSEYLPVCGIGVLEEMTGVETGLGDPFAEYLDHQGAEEIFEHQRQAIAAAAELVRDVPAPVSVPVGPGRSD